VDARPYRIDSVLGGRAPAAASPALEEGAAEVIRDLHRATAADVRGDAVAARWVDAPLRELARHGEPRGAVADRVRRLSDELHEGLTGRRFTAGWIHGDYWLGNLLLADGEARPAGIADWEGAAEPELPLHDLLHLMLSGRRLRTGQQLGALVRDRLAGSGWADGERRWLDRHVAWCHDGSLSDRHALLLYWLRQVALHARQQSRVGGGRYRVWERRNVHAVVAAL
jgi:Phosphotransferase enzyme family